ncbi:MAG: glucose-1-phosphate adenylyltransferase [bacterium]|nr:glucose-1-phosphate adenylyltransferase [bacterium]
MKDVLAIIMAGGKGNRLSVLSEKRAKPAVPFAGRYRLIDFTLSNCVNSGIYDVAVLTQYRPRSLSKHIGIGRPWDLDRKTGGVEILQPYLGHADSGWYKGTADAVYRNHRFVETRDFENVLILSGDHVYSMDYRKMLRFHREREANLTVACMQVAIEDAHRFGVMSLAGDGYIHEFAEKPEEPKSDIASMGIYIFTKPALLEALEQVPSGKYDFGHDIIPWLINERRVFGYLFDGYWQDVGAVAAFYDANMDLIADIPSFNLYDKNWPIYTVTRDYPPAEIRGGRVVRSLMSKGTVCWGEVYNSIISPGVEIDPGCRITDSIIMNDCRIGPDTTIDRAILDKKVEIGFGSVIGFGDDGKPNGEFPELLNTGITLVGRESTLPAGLKLGRNCCTDVGVTPDDFNRSEYAAGSTVFRRER